jgi:NitT/TauT family transport system substrate-binding protein
VVACARNPSEGPVLSRIRVLAQPHLSTAPLLIAAEEGYFRDQGLAVELLALASPRDGLPALIQGDLEVLTGSINTSFLNAIAQGARMRIVADKGYLARDGCTYLAFLTRPELLGGAELRRPDSGVPWRFSFRRGAYYEFLTDRALARSGIAGDEIEIHRLSPEAEVQALAHGRLDVAIASSIVMEKMLESGTAAVWRSAQSVLPGGQFSVVLYGPALIDRDPEAGVRFMSAYLRGVRQYNLGKTERNLEILAKRTSIDRRALESTCWIAMREDGLIDTATVLELQAWAVAKGLLSRPLALDEIWEPRFVTDAVRRLEIEGGESNVE